MLNAPSLRAPSTQDLRRSLIRSAAIAVSETAPLEVIDPRGMIFDRAPSGEWTMRIRGSDRQMVLGLGPEDQPWVRPNTLAWRALDLADDTKLPGRALLRDPKQLSDLVGISGPLTQSLRTYRYGRRAMLRVAPKRGGKGRYLKLLSRKAYRKATESLRLAERASLDCIVTPCGSAEDLCALVFEEVREPALHERVWSGSEPDWDLVLTGLKELSGAEIDTPIKARNIETERAATVRLLEISVDFLPELVPLVRAVIDAKLPVLEGRGVLHGDLHDKQIFLRRSDIRLIDAETLAEGPAEIDLVNLTEHIRLRGLQGCEGADALATGLWRATGVDRRRHEVVVLTALVRARLAAVYARRPWWWGVSLALASDAQALLEGL